MARWTPGSVRHALGSAISSASYLGWESKRLVTQENMSRVLNLPVSDPRVRRTAQVSWTNYGRYAADFMYFPHMNMTTLAANMRDLTPGVSWQTHGNQASQAGKGVIIASAHFGNWDVAGALLGMYFPVSGVTETFTDPRLNELLQNQRREKKIEIIPMEGSARRILRALQANRFVAIVVDRPMTPESGVEVRFFGRKTYVPAGPAALSLKSGAAILPGYVWYGLHKELYVRAFPPIFPRKCQGTEARDQEIRRLTQCVYDSLEELVREWPTQWYMFRRFWPVDDITQK